MFCSAVRCASWGWGICDRVEEVEKSAKKKDSFAVDHTPLFNGHEDSNSLRDPRLKRQRDTNVMAKPIHFWCK